MRRLELDCMRATKGSSPYRPNREGFTLIEVMVAAILISVVGLSMLQMHNNSTQMSYKMHNKFKYSDWTLMAAFEHKLEKTTKNTSFSNLSKEFNIDERDIRNAFNVKTRISSEQFKRISASDMMKEIEDQAGEDEGINPIYDGLRLEVYQEHVDIQNETYSLYRILKP